MSYLYLGIRYFKNGRHRTVWTIIGVTMVASFLLTAMWITFSAIDFNLKSEREYLGFDIAVKSADPDLAADLIADPKISGVTVGTLENLSYYLGSDQAIEDPASWNETPVLFVQLKNPRKIQEYCSKIRTDYGVETAWNKKIPDLIDNRDLANAVALLLCYIVSISGVAMVRNTLQLSAMEQIKDYGNLRCIGATKNQLRLIQYVQGVMLVSVSLLSALILSLIVTGVFNALSRAFFRMVSEEYPTEFIYQIRVLPLPILYVVSGFFFDLYFILRENLKSVYGMSPAEAVSGHFRILNKKVRPRKAKLIRMLFGIEGEYAYKNLMRYPGRFWRNVGLLTLIVTSLTVAFCYLGEHLAILIKMQKQFSYYQICVAPEDSYFNTWHRTWNDEALADYYDHPFFAFQPKESLEDLLRSGFVTDTSALYQRYLITAEGASEYAREDYNPQIDSKNSFLQEYSGAHSLERFKPEHTWGFRAYTEEEKTSYCTALTAGTMDVDENGIVLINGAKNIDPWTFFSNPAEHHNLTVFQIGDQILVPDPVYIEEKYSEWLENVFRNEEVMLKLFRAENPESEDTDARILESIHYKGFRNRLCDDQYRKLYEEAMESGRYNIYTIEGILSVDPLYSTEEDSPVFLLPKENYFQLTGEDENTAVKGLCYHIEHPVFFAFYRLYCSGKEPLEDAFGSGTRYYYIDSIYTAMISNWGDQLANMSRICLILLFAIAGFLFVSFINIRNATNSSLFLRKKEFAQLYVIGCTNRSIGLMVRYEGFISGSFAIILGAVVGLPGYFLIRSTDLMFLFYLGYSFSWWVYPLALVLASLPVIGFYALSIGRQSRKMHMNAAEDLITAGE